MVFVVNLGLKANSWEVFEIGIYYIDNLIFKGFHDFSINLFYKFYLERLFQFGFQLHSIEVHNILLVLM